MTRLGSGRGTSTPGLEAQSSPLLEQVSREGESKPLQGPHTSVHRFHVLLRSLPFSPCPTLSASVSLGCIFCCLFFQSLLNLLQYCFCLMFWFLGCQTCGISAPQPGIELPALEDDGLTPGPPRKTAVSGPSVPLCLCFSLFLSCSHSPSYSLFSENLC